jgi:hypothetical protein
MIDSSLITINDLTTKQVGQIAEYITDFSVSYRMDGVSEISFSVIDPDFAMMKGNYFQIRRNMVYRNMPFEIAAVEVGRGPGSSPQINIQARSTFIQLMKRDKQPRAIGGASAYDFARLTANRFFLKFYGQSNPTVQSQFQVSSGNNDESVWDVLNRAASSLQYALFESDGSLFFASQAFLLGKIGIDTDPSNIFTAEGSITAFGINNLQYIPITYPTPATDSRFVCLDMPRVRRSDNDPLEGAGSVVLDRTNAVNIRPGMTIGLKGLPNFEGLYLVSAVEFMEGVPDPVNITFQTAVVPDPKKVK